jgi:hypothetical protein
MLSHNLIGKSDQLVVYASKFLNKTKCNYSNTKREALTMVFALHKFIHYLLGNKLVFYVDHITFVYLVNKPHVLGKVARWLQLLLKYYFTILYKPCRTHVVVDVLSRLPNIIEPTRLFI